MSDTFSSLLGSALAARLESLASRIDRPVDECLRMAASDFIASWEDHLRTVEEMDRGEARPILKVVND